MKSLVKSPVEKRAKGYTLIEMSIVMIVVGIALASAASAYNIYLKNKAIADTASNVNTVMNAISNYFIQNGKYPCPARLDALRTDSDYGMPTACTTDPAILAMNPGDYLNGLYMEERASTIPTLVPPKPIVLRGAVPFRVLNKPEYVTEDGYHNRLEYVVTEILTNTTTYHKDHGGISVIDDQNRSVVKDTDTIHFIVLSHGPDKEGAWSNNGAPVLPCGSGMDAENCNTSTPNKQAVYRMAQTRSASGTGHFDDFVKFFSMIETPLWTVADAAGTNIRDAGLALQAAIGQSSSSFPSTDPLSLDVVAHVRADSNLHMAQMCNASGGDCFSPALIGGNDPAMDCTDPTNPLYDASKPYVTGVGSGKVTCGSTVEVKCPSGQVMKGITVTGSLICTTPPASCPATNVTVCTTNDDALPASPSGAVVTTAIHGDSRQHTYTCLSTGAWSAPTITGYCSCTPGTVTTTPPCQGYMAPSGSCWTGNVILTTTTTCSPYSVSASADTSACVCSDCAVPNALTCSALQSPLTNPGDVPAGLPAPVGWIGSITYTNNWQCSSATTGSFVDWTYVSNTCACNTSITPLVETNVACTVTGCDSSGAAVPNGQLACSPGFAGAGKYVNRHKNYNCATGSYDAVWTNDANTCSCTAVTAPDPIPCPTGYSGTINRTKTFNCVTNAWDPAVNDLPGSPPSSCTPIQWVPQGSISGSGSSTAGYVEAYTGCSPVNSTSSCFTNASGGGYNYYTLCKCQ